MSASHFIPVAHDLLRRQTVIMTVAAARQAEEMWAAPLGHRQRRLLGLEPAMVASGEAGDPVAPVDGEPPVAEEAAPPVARRRRRTPRQTEDQPSEVEEQSGQTEDQPSEAGEQSGQTEDQQ